MYNGSLLEIQSRLNVCPSSESRNTLPSCPGFKDSKQASSPPFPPQHFESSRKHKEKKASSAPVLLPHPERLHQASLRLVGLRMEHDDRQKQVLSTSLLACLLARGAWKGCHEVYNRQEWWINSVSKQDKCGWKAVRIFTLFVFDTDTAEGKNGGGQAMWC